MAEQLERGKCRAQTCRAPIVWIQTPRGKAVPCDDVAFSGYVLRKGATPKGWRQGYTVAGRVVRILPDAAPRPPTPLIPDAEESPLTEERATIRETHFATCPARQRFRQIQEDRKRKAEDRQIRRDRGER